MEIPEEEIVALLEYVESDLELGIQINTEEWERTTKNVREWLSGLTQRSPDVLPQCEKCGSSFLWSNDDSAVCCNPECGNRR